MSNLRYIGRAGSVELDGPLVYSGPALGLRGREWKYTAGTHALRTSTRAMVEAEVKVTALDMDEATRLGRIMDADIAAGEAGKLVALGEWEQRAVCVKSKAEDRYAGGVVLTLTLVLLDGCWTRLVTRSYMPRTATGGYGWLDLPTGFPADLGPSLPTSSVTVGCLVRPNVRLVIYGPCVNPYVIVGGNRYTVNRTIAEGERVEVDGRYKTIVQVLADGTRVSRFADGVRTGGEGGGSYIFERLPVSPYPIALSWDNSFGFDLCWYEEEGEPPWSQS